MLTNEEKPEQFGSLRADMCSCDECGWSGPVMSCRLEHDHGGLEEISYTYRICPVCELMGAHGVVEKYWSSIDSSMEAAKLEQEEWDGRRKRIIRKRKGTSSAIQSIKDNKISDAQIKVDKCLNCGETPIICATDVLTDNGYVIKHKEDCSPDFSMDYYSLSEPECVRGWNRYNKSNSRWKAG